MATYEYLCLACEHPFEERRPMGVVDTALCCPSCGSERVRRRFSMFATGGSSPSPAPGSGSAAGPAGGCCGGGCCG